jgi:hypothetical protein
MEKCTIDAEYKGEERYSKLTLAYSTEAEHGRIEDAIKTNAYSSELEPQIYNSDVSNGRKVIVIEFHDDYDRAAGTIFESIMKELNIKECF